MKTVRQSAKRNCTAIIADMVGSRNLDAETRRTAQTFLRATLAEWNRIYRKSILSRFTITTGDEFQGLLHDPGCVPDLIRSLEMKYFFEVQQSMLEFRFGVGFGSLFTDLTPTAIGMDGPVWHLARSAIVQAKEEDELGGVFHGFGDDGIAMNAIARFLQHHYQSMTHQQRVIVDLLRKGMTVSEIATELSIPRTNVSRQKKAIAWSMLAEGDSALKTLLERFVTTEEWSD